MRYASEHRSLDESIEELREIADGRNDILAEAAGITAGCWYASPATHVGHELIGPGVLILAGGGQGFPLDMTSSNVGHPAVGRVHEQARLGERAPGVVEPERAVHSGVASLGGGANLLLPSL